MEWTQEQLDLLENYHEEKMHEAEEEIETSSYPPDQEREIDINQHIVWLVREMKNEKSWIYRLCHPAPSDTKIS